MQILSVVGHALTKNIIRRVVSIRKATGESRRLMTDTSCVLSCSPPLSACAIAVDGAVHSRGVLRYNFGYSRQAFKHTLGIANSTLQTKGLPRLEFVGATGVRSAGSPLRQRESERAGRLSTAVPQGPVFPPSLHLCLHPCLHPSLHPAANMMKECLQFLIEPAKKLKIRLKESRKRVRHEKKEPLVESQLFIMELARELNRLCQRSSVLAHIWTSEDSWPPAVCRDFIVQWASVLENRVQTRVIHTELQTDRPEKRDWRGHLLCMLEIGGEYDMGPHKRVIMDWTRELKNRPEPSVWPGEPVLMMLDDLEFQWRRGRLPNLLPAMELVMWTLLNADRPDKEDVPRQWLVNKQRAQSCDAARYIPHNVWNWIIDASVDVTLDPDTAHRDLVVSEDRKRLRCGPDPQDVPRCARRFSGWWCALAKDGFTSGRHYWEVEVGERDWRVGVAKASAQRKGYRSLNTDTGFLTLRLERGVDLKALTVPATPLPTSLAPRKVGVFLDYDEGQLSFYDAERRSHLYTFSQTFTEELFPVFGTVEVVRELMLRPAGSRGPCLCPGPCLWN